VPEVLPRQADTQPAGRQETHVLPRLRLIGPKRPLAAFAAAVASGVLLFLSNPPADLGPLAFVALIPLLWALGEGRPGRGAAVGFAFGLTYFGLLLHWLKPFGIIAWLPLVADQAGFAALFGAVTAVLLRQARKRPGSAWAAAIGAAGAWTALDWVRAVWPVGGFTWGALAYTQHGNHLVLPLASITGMWGVTFVVLLVNALVFTAVTRIRQSWKPAAVAAALAAAAVGLPVLIPLPAATGRPLDVAVIQGNVPRELASDRLLQTAVVAKNHVALHRQLAGDPPDLAVWPESSLPDDPAAVPALGTAVADAVRAVGAPTLVGAVADAPEGRLYNQAILYSGAGRIVGRYSKLHLVPGGEYIPFRAVFGWTDRYRRGNAVLAPGTGIRLFDVDGVKVGTPICFENVFPDLFRRFVSRGANVMVLTTNDSSFLESEASREHVIISQLRAVETGRWVVQAAISGESAVIDATGRVRARTGLFEQRILRAPIPTSEARTLYVRVGDWFPLAAAIAAFVILITAMRRRQGSSEAEPDAPPAGEPGEGAETRSQAPISGGGEPRVLVVLPTFNEAGTIGRVVSGVLHAGPNVDVLVVDDSSPDGTAEVVSDLAENEPRIRMMVRGGKQGLASAYLEGFRMALREGYDIVVEMDSDLSHLPEELPRLLDGAERFDLTIGSRYVPGGAVSNWSRTRQRISRAGNAYARALLRMPVHDATSGYRAYRRPVLEALIGDGIHSEGYAFQIELAYRAWRQGFKVGEVPITFREREQGSSKFSRAIVLEALGKVTQWGVRDRFRRNHAQQRGRSRRS
jgi:apolipoprotein N-acyltransferase